MNGNPRPSTSWSEIIAGVLLGTAIGAVAALLYAPKKGEETRAELLARLDAAKQRLDATAVEVAALAKERLSECCSDLQQAVIAGREATRERVAELQQQTGSE